MSAGESKSSKTDEIKEILVKSSLHIGSQIKVKHMEKFIFKLRPDGVYLIDISKTIERLNIAARFISFYPPEKVVVISTHVYGIKPVKRFCELTGCISVTERFEPGSFTNPDLPSYIEPELIVVSDPRYDNQAVLEAKIARIPVIAMCSTDNSTSNIDLVVPMNNRGRLALPYAFWYLTRRVLIEKAIITEELADNIKPEEFIAQQVAES